MVNHQLRKIQLFFTHMQQNFPLLQLKGREKNEIRYSLILFCLFVIQLLEIAQVPDEHVSCLFLHLFWSFCSAKYSFTSIRFSLFINLF